MLMNAATREPFGGRDFTLRGGGTVTLRSLRTDDGERLARFYESIPREDIRFYCG